jgi:hypothetical protein
MPMDCQGGVMIPERDVEEGNYSDYFIDPFRGCYMLRE